LDSSPMIIQTLCEQPDESRPGDMQRKTHTIKYGKGTTALTVEIPDRACDDPISPRYRSHERKPICCRKMG
jgi:hypothetical protein